MTSRTGIALAAIFAASSPIIAQEAPADLQREIVEMVETFVNAPEHADAIESWIDLDRDGIEEALVSLPPNEVGLIEWHVFGGKHGRAADLVAWTSRSLELVEQPKGRDVDGRPIDGTDLTLIVADGITFKKLPYSVTPIDDFFSTRKIRQRPATSDELALLKELGYPGMLIENAQALTGDFLDIPGRERLFSLTAEYMADDHETFPYLLIGADDSVIMEGRSSFHPWIYRDEVNGVQLVERNSHGLSLVQLDPGKDE